MPFAQALLALVAVNLLIIAVQAIFLWLGARWFSIPGLSYARAVAACLVIGLVCLGIGAAGAWGGLRLEELSLGGPDPLWSRVQPALPLVVFAIQVLVAWLAVKWLVGGWWDQAALAAVIMLVAGFVAASIFNGAMKSMLFEPYSVPRAAMAPAVLGVHTDVTCTNCSFIYAYHMGDRLQGARWSPRSAKPTTCPNCGQEAKVLPDAPVRAGDTVLVDKMARPARWDLLLYRHRPEAGQQPRVFLKRLVGLPGETVEIVGGDVFVDGRRLRKEPYMARDMWILVYDTQYLPVRPVPDAPKWLAAAGSKWRVAGGKWSVAAGETPVRLNFSGRIADDLAYNDREPHDAPSPRVGDVKLDVWLEEFSGKGNIALDWEFRGLRATATISASGNVELIGHGPPIPGSASDGQRVTARGHLAGGLPAGQQISFAFRDGQAYVEQSGIVVASLPLGPQDLQTAKSAPFRVAGPCLLSFAATRCGATISRLVLWRDVYYRSLDEMPGSPMASGWGSTNHPLTLPEGSYFLLGDDGLRSQDSRSIGPLRAESLIGVCRWIYWPPDRWRRFR